MLALGAYLLVSVATATPAAPVHAVEKLASTYDEATCDPADGGECALEAVLSDYEPAPAILDCESPFIAGMIGSCDMPKPSWPQLHVPTLRSGNGGALVGGGHGNQAQLHVVPASSSVDGALAAKDAFAQYLMCDRITELCARTISPLFTHRLDRPPRA